jgi:hypothetical protein
MLPRLASAQFGLLDDGVTLLVARHLLAEPTSLLTQEATSGRLRPTYWLFYTLYYVLWGSSPTGYFVMQWLVLCLTSLAITSIIATITRDYIAAPIGGLLYATSGPVWESYYTLSKPEPPLVLWLALSQLCLFMAMFSQKRRLRWVQLTLSIFFLAAAYLTKETTVVMLPISIALLILVWLATRGLADGASARVGALTFVIGNLICLVLFLLLRFATGTADPASGTYSVHYQITPDSIRQTSIDEFAWVVRDFAYLVPIALLGSLLPWLDRSAQRLALLLCYGCLFATAWVVVMLPWWDASLEYFLLPVSLGVVLATAGGVALAQTAIRSQDTWKMLLACTALVSTAALASIPIINGVATGAIQLNVDEANAEMLRSVAQATPGGGRVALAIPPDSEYVAEARLQLQMLYDRSDIDLQGSDNLPPPLGAVLAVPHTGVRPIPAPRIALSSSGKEPLAVPVEQIDSSVRSIPLFRLGVDQIACRQLRKSFATDKTLCSEPKVLLAGDAREMVRQSTTFTYGWDIFRRVAP